MRKEYVSPLFEEIVLMTEDVLTISGPDNLGDGNDVEDGDAQDDFTF